MVHAKHAIDFNSPVIIRSKSGDTDIFIMALTLFYSANFIRDSGTGTGKKIVRMSDVEIEEDNKNALISFHVITGYNYASSFFLKEKTISWKTINSKSRFKEVMIRFGENDAVNDDLCRKLGKFVWIMYGGGRARDVNALWFNNFTEKQNRENKYMDLSALLPCQATLNLHILRTNVWPTW